MNTPENTKTAPKISRNHFTFIPILLAALTPIFFLHGRAYHDGYLSYLKLNSTMFPMSNADTMITATLAWMHAATSGLKGVESIVVEHPWFLASIPFISLLFGSLNYALKKFSPVLKKNETARKKNSTSPSWWREVARCFLMIFIPCYGILASMIALSMIILLMVGPFVYVGEAQAQKDFMSGFKDSPTIELAGDETGTKYQLILCSTEYCALFTDGTTQAVAKKLILRTERSQPASALVR